MKSKAAVLWDLNQPFEVVELDLEEPRQGEVLVRYVAAGFCHSDDLLRTGDIMPRFPLVGGHEGSGVVEAVGPGVTRVAVGDHVVTSFIPACGHCRWCSTGRQNLCDDGATILEGRMPDGSFRFSGRGQDVGAYCMIGTFAERSVVSERSLIPVDKSLPLDKIVTTACGVPTGWGASVYVADIQPGETVVIYGIGGLGSAAVQGAVHAGATNLIAVDPLENKRQMAKQLGATHTAATAEEAHEIAMDLTRGVGADKSLVITDLVQVETTTAALDVISKGGTTVFVGLNGLDKMNVVYPSQAITLNEKTIKGTLYGSCSPNRDVPKLLDLYKAGRLELDALVTNRYSLDQVNEAYADLNAGRNIRGILDFSLA
ncbi:NDMA-dependent alcohol dehydrogenase [Nocardioides humi]|uniref:NDMA-dependent alcohol dehydrogenase n=1 Tax=Nocardioides humi TaxID=449461 RepID=A0ABN2BX36_9ACTN|nr:NDMA-dependent alcohol dehydrogenase [Nocardioides humi]